MRVYLSYSARDAELARKLRSHLSQNNYRVLTTPRTNFSDFATVQETMLSSSDAVVVLLVEGRSAETFIELGLARGLRLPTMLIVKSGRQLPIAARGVPYVDLSEDFSSTAIPVVRFLSRVAQERPEKLKAHDVKTSASPIYS